MPHIYSVNDQEAMCVRLHLLQEKWKKEILEDTTKIQHTISKRFADFEEKIEENLEEKIEDSIEDNVDIQDIWKINIHEGYIDTMQRQFEDHEEKMNEQIKQILEEQERMRVCHRDEIQKLQETVRKQEEKIKTLLECLMI